MKIKTIKQKYKQTIFETNGKIGPSLSSKMYFNSPFFFVI